MRGETTGTIKKGLHMAGKKWIAHVLKEGSREHVVSWDGQGAKCSCAECEINKGRRDADT